MTRWKPGLGGKGGEGKGGNLQGTGGKGRREQGGGANTFAGRPKGVYFWEEARAGRERRGGTSKEKRGKLKIGGNWELFRKGSTWGGERLIKTAWPKKEGTKSTASRK